MNLKALWITPLLLTLATGCTGTVAGGAGADAGANPGSSAGTGTPLSGAFPFVVGKQWAYGLETLAAGKTTSGEIAWEVTELSSDAATLKFTSTIAGQTQSTTTTVKRTAENPFLQSSSSEAGVTPTMMGTESVMVPAGTFNADKYVGTKKDDQGEFTYTYWIDKSVGLIKQVTVSKPAVPAGLPAGFDLSSTTTMTLKSHK